MSLCVNRNTLGFEIIPDHAVSFRAPGLQIGYSLQCLMLFSVVYNGAQVSPSFGVSASQCLKFIGHGAGSLKCRKIGCRVVFFPEVLRKQPEKMLVLK